MMSENLRRYLFLFATGALMAGLIPGNAAALSGRPQSRDLAQQLLHLAHVYDDFQITQFLCDFETEIGSPGQNSRVGILQQKSG